MNRFVFTAVLFTLSFSASACGSSRPQSWAGFRIEYPGALPADVESHPHCYYRDRFAYLVGDRWFYRSSFGWLFFVDEPEPLKECRTRLQAPPT